MYYGIRIIRCYKFVVKGYCCYGIKDRKIVNFSIFNVIWKVILVNFKLWNIKYWIDYKVNFKIIEKNIGG